MIQAEESWIGAAFKKGLVSVIIPTFNRANLLGETIQSLHNQNYRPIECLIVDDGSKDSTEKVVAKLKKKLEESSFIINFIKQPNSGAPAARNNGTIHSSGEFIQYLDSDDLLYPEKIVRQINYLAAEPNCDGVFGDWHYGTQDNYQFVKSELSDDPIAQFYGAKVVHTLSFLFRRRIVKKIGPWDVSLHRNQEMDFHLRGVLVGGRFEYFPTLTGLWREHEGERIVSNSGAGEVLRFYKKWMMEFEKREIFTTSLRNISAEYLFWNALLLEPSGQHEILKYLRKVLDLNPEFPELSTPKMRILRQFFGRHLSIRLWYWQCRRNQNSHPHKSQ